MIQGKRSTSARSIIFYTSLIILVIIVLILIIAGLSEIFKQSRNGELQEKSSIGLIGFILFAVPSLISLFLIYFSFKKEGYFLAFGGLIGAILAIVNGFSLGILGSFFFIPFSSFCSGGDKCWGYLIYIGSFSYLILGFLVGWIIGKIKSKKQKNDSFI